MTNTYHWTSEAVGPGHPDKVADQISDAILDAYLEKDGEAKVACETLVKDNRVVVAGEVSSHAEVDIDRVVRQTILDIGYSSEKNLGFDEKCEIINFIGLQSPEINKAVVGGLKTGAGDQGIMFGYADSRGDNQMPLAISTARNIIEIAQSAVSKGLHPDCKSQVTFEHSSSGVPFRISHIVLSMHHDRSISLEDLKGIYYDIMLPRLNLEEWVDNETKHHINPAGAWHDGGPAFDAGLTGRKIVADNYGADCQIGGGAFSGKDPTKVDRSAAYAARHIAKNLVAADLAERSKVQLSYAIGEANPISIHVDSMGTCRNGITDKLLNKWVSEIWDLTPDGIINKFQLRKPIYKKTAGLLGHFGIDQRLVSKNEWLWEKLDATELGEYSDHL